MIDQIQASINQLDLPTMSSDDLGTTWVMAKSKQERYSPNSPEHKLLSAFMKDVHKHMVANRPAPALSPMEQERLNNKADSL